MGRTIRFALVLGAFWALVGVLAGAHKGAMFAAVVGFILLVIDAVGMFGNWEYSESNTPLADVIATLLWLVSIPIALLTWGNHSSTGGGAFKIVFWMGVVALAFKAIAYVAYLFEKKFGQ